ncbi:MAG: TlpA disulfide reductase family protein [Burkholderiaceae bacterium]
MKQASTLTVTQTMNQTVSKRAFCLSLISASLLATAPIALAQSQPVTTGTVTSPTWVIGQKPQLPPLPLLSGKTHRFDSHAGRVLIIEFWHTKCPFCKKQNPLLDAFYRKHKARGLDVVTVSIDKKLADAQDYMKDHGYAFAAGLADPVWHAIYKQRKGLPQLFVIDRAGVLRQIELREMFPDDILELERYL